MTITSDAINYIVDKASSMNMGARSLKSIVETAMVNILFNLDGIKGNTLTLTKYDLEKVFSEKESVNSSKEEKKLDSSNKNFSKDEQSYMA